MNVSLTPELEKFVAQKTKSGLYNSASEVIRQALRVLITFEDQKTAQIARLNRDIEEGLLDLEHGRIVEGDSVLTRLRAKNTTRKTAGT
jgi:antitoxin ParD1/3/4